MSGLPKLDLPIYKHKLTGLKKTVSYRPFTVKEQKILLLAKESDDLNEIIDSMKQVVDLCTFGKLDVETLPIFDFEDLFLRIRTKSVSDECELMYKIKDTDETVTVKVNLNDVKVQTTKDHTNKVMITDTMGIQLKYPTINSFKAESDDAFLKEAIEFIFDEDEVYTFSDYPEDEQLEWLDSLDSKTALKIKEFFDTIPVLKHQVIIESKEGKQIPITLRGLDDFFI